MDTVRSIALFVSAAVGAFTFALNYRLNDRHDRKVKNLLEQAESPELPERIRKILVDEANQMISWTAARTKYPSKTTLTSNIIFLMLFLAFYVFVLTPLYFSRDASPWIDLMVTIVILVSGASILRKLPGMDADFTRQKLCQLSGGADISEVERPYSAPQALKYMFKPKDNRPNFFRYSLMVVILREAWNLQVCEKYPENGTIDTPIHAVPGLEAIKEWEQLAASIHPRYVNRAIKQALHR